MANKHGAQFYVVDGEIFSHQGRMTHREGFFFDVETRELFGPPDLTVSNDTIKRKTSLGPVTEYTRLFSGKVQALSQELLVKLGCAMLPENEDDAGDPCESAIPAGYTYLGQFIAHDMTLMRRSSSDEPQNYRSPRFDLDSVYEYDKAASLYPCSDNSGPLPIGCTGNFGHVNFFHEDLPRSPTHEAVIGDLRNDDILPVAQTHLAIMKFANRVSSIAVNADEARELCTKHVQSVVLHDYLRRTCDGDVWEDVAENWRAIVVPRRMSDDDHGEFKIPIEFAMAFRFGHSMVRSTYPNWVFKRNATLKTFWNETYNNGRPDFGVHHQGIGGVWVNNWYRLLDFTGTRYEMAQTADAGAVIQAAAINTYLTRQLARIPEESLPNARVGHQPFPQTPNLAVRTLLMHHALELLDGREIAIRVRESLAQDLADRPDFRILEPDEILRDEPFVNYLTKNEKVLISEHPPLWFYVLKEAQILSDGLKLGPFGSRIVLETIHAAIEAADMSILRERWAPDSRLEPTDADHYTLPCLVAFAGNPAPVS